MVLFIKHLCLPKIHHKKRISLGIVSLFVSSVVVVFFNQKNIHLTKA